MVDEMGEFLNFREVSVDHTNDMEVARFISDNLEQAVVIE